MTPTIPVCCSPDAFKLMSRQIGRLDTTDGLLAASVAVSMHQDDNADPRAVERRISGLADEIRGRVRGTQPQALLAHLHAVLFDEEGFVGNRTDYYNPVNSYLGSVLDSKQGMPIALALVYHLVASRLGLHTWGVGLPGHFLIGVGAGADKSLVDCFDAGRLLTQDEAHELLKAHQGPDTQWSSDYLKPVSHRQWLTRMLQNLLNYFGAEDRYADMAAMLELEMLLWPDKQHLQRDLGLVLARCGMSRPASVWLDRYLQSNPDDPQSSELRQLRDVLR